MRSGISSTNLDSRAASPLIQNVTSIHHVLLVPATNQLDAQNKSCSITAGALKRPAIFSAFGFTQRM